jgi:hypothetical protein
LEVIIMDSNNNLPIGCTQKKTISDHVLENYCDVGCYVSIQPPCLPVEKGSAIEFFNKYGYLVIRGIHDHKKFIQNPPKERGSFSYYGSIERCVYEPVEGQVNGALARYNHPKYKDLHTQIRLKLQKILKDELYNTYYYDRFYFTNQRLTRHTDRDACEISFTFQISSNSNKKWPIFFKTPKGEERYVLLEDGDGIVYKGCDIEHWRESLPSRHNLMKQIGNKLIFKPDDTYHHQAFFHYVRANGDKCHFAGDVNN